MYYCGAERLSQLYPIMLTKKYEPAMKAELMEGEEVQELQLFVWGSKRILTPAFVLSLRRAGFRTISYGPARVGKQGFIKSHVKIMTGTGFLRLITK